MLVRTASAGIHGDDLGGGGKGILLDVLKHGVELLGTLDLLQEVVHLGTLVCKSKEQGDKDVACCAHVADLGYLPVSKTWK